MLSFCGITLVPAGSVQLVNIPLIPIPQFKDGGFPETGQMFIAREAGAELVGNIGGRTAVANNDQIVEAVSQGVYKAVVEAMPRNSSGDTTVVLQVGETELGRATIKAINGVQRSVGKTLLEV